MSFLANHKEVKLGNLIPVLWSGSHRLETNPNCSTSEILRSSLKIRAATKLSVLRIACCILTLCHVEKMILQYSAIFEFAETHPQLCILTLFPFNSRAAYDSIL